MSEFYREGSKKHFVESERERANDREIKKLN